MATKKNAAKKQLIDDIKVTDKYGYVRTARDFHKEGPHWKEKDLLSWNEAWYYLKAGVPVKRLSWEGYWQMENGKLVMHCKDGSLVGLDSCDEPFTLENIAQLDWLPLNQRMKDNLDEIHTSGVLNYRGVQKKTNNKKKGK